MVWGSRRVFGTLIGSAGSAEAMVTSDEKLVGNEEAFWMSLLNDEGINTANVPRSDRRLQRESGSFMGESSWIARRPAESLDRGGAGR